MARYDVAPARFASPRGHDAIVYLREGTNDWNTAFSCLNEDEYGVRDTAINGTFVDVGGYLGTFALGVLLDNPEARAIIVEPIPENLALIEDNLAVNGVADRATVIAGCVGSGSTTIDYAFSHNETTRHHAFVGNSMFNDAAQPHKSVTYEGLSWRAVAPADAVLAKIDCEGGEWAVLHEMTAVPLIVGEYHPVALPDGTTGSRERLAELLGATHDIVFAGPPDSPAAWGFRAVLKQPGT